MRNKSSLLMIALTVLFFLSLNFSDAATWYVRTTGNNANSGNTPAAAKLTIQAMVNGGSVANGDIIDIGAGTFQEQVVINSKSLTLQGAGEASTTIQAPVWATMTIYSEPTLLYWNFANVAAVSLPTASFKPIVYIDAASNSYTTNIYGIRIDGNSAAPAAPTELFVGVMYKNSQGTVGASTSNYPVRVLNMDGANGNAEDNVFGFGIMSIGTANPVIQYSTFTDIHSVSIASIGRSLSSTLVSQMPYPTVRDNVITGSSMNNTGWHAGIMTAYGGRITAQRNLIRSHRNAGTGLTRTGGVHIYDGRTALIGSNSVKADGNTITDNDLGLNVIVTNSIIGTPTNYTIKNNTIVYNGNGFSGYSNGANCLDMGHLTSGAVRYENTTSTATRTLTLNSNAWGNSDPLNNGYTYTLGGNVSTDAFWSVTAGDAMSVSTPQSSQAEQVNLSYSNSTAGWGFSAFNTIQQAVNAAGNPDTILVATGTYGENVCVFSKRNVAIIGDSMATCGSNSKPVINPGSGNAMHIFTSTTSDSTTNIAVNGFFFDQEGAQTVGVLVTGWDNTDNLSNNPPLRIKVRNTCFKDYATQAADGNTAATSAAMSTQEYPVSLNPSAQPERFAWGGAVPSATPYQSDIDAQANNNFNYSGVSTSPSFKLWEKGDDVATNDLAAILQTNLIIVFCGDDLNAALGALGSGPVTVYLQGDCIYKNNTLDINGPFDIRVDYTGRVNLPPLIVAPNGINYNSPAAGLSWATDCHVDPGPGIRFVTNATQEPLAAGLTNGHYPSGTFPVGNASSVAMKALAPANFGGGAMLNYQTTNYGLDRPANITVVGNNDFALLDAINDIADTNGYAGTVTVADAAAFTTPFTLQKRIRFATTTGAGNATTTGAITLINKVLPDVLCAPVADGIGIDGVLDTRVTQGTFTSLTVNVGVFGSGVVTDRADNTDTTNTIQQGLVFTRAMGGSCRVNNLGDYTTGTAQTPIISRNQVTLTSDDAALFVQLEGGSITLNGSGAFGSHSTITRFSVDTVKMSVNTDYIQTALGVAGSQDDEGVGLDNQAGNTTGATAIANPTQRTGKIVLNFAGATAASQTLTVEKDVRFIGNSGTPNTNAGSLTMNLGAQGTMIDNSTNFCNTTVNATQAAGSGYFHIPDIQTGILLACTSGTLNVGTTGVATSWGSTNLGAGIDSYNRDNTITKALTVQATNNFALCGFLNSGGGSYVVDGASIPAADAGRAFFTRFFNFAPANPVFKINAVSNVTIQGFDFVTLNAGTANALIYSDSASNTVLINNNNFDESNVRPIYSAGAPASTNKTNWGISCNWIHRTVGGLVGPPDGIALERHSTTNNITDNAIDYNGYTSGSTNGVRLLGVQNAQVLRNYIRAISTTLSNISVDSLTTATGQASATGTLNIQDNDILNNTSVLWGGIGINKLFGMSGTITIQNNFIRANTTGIRLGTGTFEAISNTGWSIINNSFTNTTNALNYSPTYSGTVCQLNARGNWWEHASGPTNTFNPLNPTPCTAATFGDVLIQTGNCSTGEQSMTSFIPWWTIGTDAAAGTDGWQQPAAANALARVVRTSSVGVWLENYANINNAVDDIDANSQKVFAIQGVFGWLPVSGMGDDWGEYFSEQVSYNGNGGGYTGNEIRGVTIKAYDCANTTMETWHTYLATTSNVTAPVPSGDIVHAPAAPISGNEQTGFFIDGQTATNADNTTIRNFRVQGFSSTGTPLGIASPGGKAIMFDRVTNPSVDACWIEGSALGGATRGSIGIYLDRSTGGLLTSNVIGTNQAISSSSGSNAGIGIVLGDASQTTQTFGPNTVGQNAATATAAAMGLGITSGGNIIRNCERVGITVGHGVALAGSMGATTIVQYNTIQGVRDVVGTGGVVAIAGIHADATAGTLQINNNTIGGKGLTTQNDNNVDIEFASNTFTLNLSSMNNTIRDSAQVVDGENYTVGSVSGGTRATELRAFFNPASGNTFSHAAILTTDDNEPYDFTNTMIRDNDVVVIGGAVRIYRQIATPLANTNTVYNAAGGSETFNNVVEVRENAGWTASELDQYYGENLSFQSTTGLVHQLILGPKAANALDATSAHIISSTGPGTGTAITAAGRENKYLRGGLMLHAIGSGLYGTISTGTAADNKGDVYLQRLATAGADNGFVQFAYHATTFGSQATVTGTGAETGGTANANANKPTIIKAGLDDANDDSHTAGTSNQNRRTGVFQAGNGTTFTKPVEPIAGLGADGMTAFPNPSNGGTVTVQFSVPTEAMVRVALYDALGRKVTDLREGTLNVGVYNADFDVNNLPSGTYTVRMEYDYSIKTVQVHVIK